MAFRRKFDPSGHRRPDRIQFFAVALIGIGVLNLVVISLLSLNAALVQPFDLRRRLFPSGSSEASAPVTSTSGASTPETIDEAPAVPINATSLPRVDIWIMTSLYFGKLGGGGAP